MLVHWILDQFIIFFNFFYHSTEYFFSNDTCNDKNYELKLY